MLKCRFMIGVIKPFVDLNVRKNPGRILSNRGEGSLQAELPNEIGLPEESFSL